MEFKGTKGKWRHSKMYDLVTTSKEGIVEGSKTICDINKDVSFDYSGKEALANTQLIVAAPELLKACKELISLLSFHGYNNATEISEGNSAINKALGIKK